MDDIWQVLFVLNLSLFFVHEMDAVKSREWRMFIVLKTMKEDKARLVFLLLHIPLYAAILLLLLSPERQVLFYVMDVFLICHAALHFGFRSHANNGFTSTFSILVIYVMGAVSAVHLIGILLAA